MNRNIIIAVPLLAIVVSIAIRRALRASQSAEPKPVAAPPNDVRHAQTGETAAGPSSSEATAPTADAESPQPLERISPNGTEADAMPLTTAQLGPIGAAIEASYESTVAAFALHGDEADYETYDARAQEDADRLQQLFSSMRAALSFELASSYEAVIDRIDAAQLQLMAFAINRKNRGLPDSSQAQAEDADRKAFEGDVERLLERVRAASNLQPPPPDAVAQARSLNGGNATR